MSICPKNKSSKARRDKRRANWKMSAPNLVKCSKCGELMMPHRVCKACGHTISVKSFPLTNSDIKAGVRTVCTVPFYVFVKNFY